MFIQKYLIFSSHDLHYISVSIIRKISTLGFKRRNQFAVTSKHSNMLQQHANATNDCWK